MLTGEKKTRKENPSFSVPSDHWSSFDMSRSYPGTIAVWAPFKGSSTMWDLVSLAMNYGCAINNDVISGSDTIVYLTTMANEAKFNCVGHF